MEIGASSLVSLDNDTRINLEYMLQTNHKQIATQYGSYVTCIRESLVSLQESQSRTMTSLRFHLLGLDACDSGYNVQKGRKLLSELEDQLKAANDIDEIIWLLQKKCASYLNIWIFLDEFHLDMSNQEALKYPVFLKQYIEKHRISEIIDKLPKLEDYFGGYTKLTFKLDISLAQKHSDLIKIEIAIAQILGISPAAIIIKDIKRGCVVVTTCIPTFVAEDIFTSDKTFSPEEEEKFRSLPVLWLQCGHSKKYEFSQNDTSNSESMCVLPEKPDGDIDSQSEPKHSQYTSELIEKTRELLQGMTHHTPTTLLHTNTPPPHHFLFLLDC